MRRCGKQGTASRDGQRHAAVIASNAAAAATLLGRNAPGAGLGHSHRGHRLCDAAVRDREHRRQARGRHRSGPPATLHLRPQPRHLLHVVDLLRLRRTGIGAELGIPGDLHRPGHGLRLRLPAAQAHHPPGEIGEDHLDRRLPGRPLRQELRGRVDRDADRRARYDPLHRAAAEGDLELRQPHGGALQRRAALLRLRDRRHFPDGGDAARRLRGAVRHAPCRRDRTPGRAGARGGGRIDRQARRLPGRRLRRHLPHLRQPVRSPAQGERQSRRGAVDGLPHVARHLDRAHHPQRNRHHHAATAVLRDDRGEPRRGGTAPGELAVPALPRPHQPVRDPHRLCRAGARRRPDQLGPLRAVAAAAAGTGPAGAGRLRRRSVGRDGHGHRGERGALDHDFQRPRHPALPAALPAHRLPREGGHDQGHPLCAAGGHLPHPLRRLPLLPGDHDQHAPGGDRADLVRGHRAVRSLADRRSDLARSQRARRRVRHVRGGG